MISSAEKRNPLLSWELLLLKFLLLALAAVLLSKPVGSISGQIAMEQDGFNLYSYDMKGHKVYAIAIGPRSAKVEEERGVWVDKDGNFKIDQLPVGEYSLRIRVPGFSTTYESGIMVGEGKVTQLTNPVRLDISQPSITVGSNARVFSTKDKPTFWANAQGSTNVNVKVYKKDLFQILGTEDEKHLGVEISSDLSLYKPYSSENNKFDVFAKKKMEPVQTWKRTLQSDLSDWSHETFKMDKPLPPGDYFAVCEATNIRKETDSTVLWFSVTDIGLIVKQDFEKTVVRALDLNSMKPLPGVSIEVRDRTVNKVLAKGTATSGADGFVEMPIGNSLSKSANSNIVVCGYKGDQHAYGGMSMYRSQGENHKTYFYTERPIYRLGQTVYFKGICRDLEEKGLSNPGSMNLSMQLEDPDNAVIWKGKVSTNKFGTFNGVFDIPKEGKTGGYQIQITYPDGSTDYERIEIDQYRKPEYKVEVIPLEARVTAGQKGKARIRATYYFGAPVTNAKIKYSIYSSADWYGRYRLMERPDYYGYFDDWESNDSDSYYGGEFISEGTAQTDASGEAIVEFDTKAIESKSTDDIFEGAYQDKKYKIDVEVTDISRLSVVNSGNLSVTAGDYVLFVEPKSYVAKVGEKIATELRAVDYQGQSVPNRPVKLTLMRRIWNTNDYSYEGTETYETLNAVTDKDGKAHVEFSTKAKYATDTYYIVAESTDAEKHVIKDDESIWVVSENDPYIGYGGGRAQEPLKVKLDKAVYEPGDTVRAMISAPVKGDEGAQAIVAVEGIKLHSYKAVDLKGPATLVEIPVDKTYAPNVYVTVTFVSKKKQFYNTSQMVKVSPYSNFLQVAVTPDKAKYHPGDMATYKLKVTKKDGNPAPNVELSMGVVDESIYAIRAEFVQDIKKFFYSQRNNNVTTVCSFPEEYSGGPNKIEPRVRKDFRDTAAWFPTLVTDSNGEVSAKFKMPDNLTTWRATVRGVSMNADVGWVLQKTVSTQDLIVRLALPRFFGQGDEGEISAIVHNYSDITQDVNLRLAISPEFQISKSLNQQVKLAPEKVSRVSWPVKVLTAGTGTIMVKAIGQTAADAMETKLPIRPLGVPVVLTASGCLTGDDQSLELPVSYPGDLADGTLKVSLHLSSSSISSVMSNFSALIDYPYGCTEQTMSRLMPAVVAVKMNKKLGVPLDKKDLVKFKEVYKQAMVKLDEYQHGDGGWGWWTTDTSNTYLTALVLEGYKLLEETGYYVDPARKKRGLDWLASSSKELQKQLSDPKLVKDYGHTSELMTDLAKASYVQALHGRKLPAGFSKWITKDSIVNHLNPESLSYYTLAFKKSGDADSAQVVYQRLLQLANLEDSSFGSLMNWERNDKMYAKLTDKKDWYSYYISYRFTPVETTALAMRACIAMQPNEIARSEQIKSWILTERGKDGWGNTKTTAEVFKALMEDEILHSTDASSFQAEVQSSGATSNDKTVDVAKSVSQFSFSKDNLFKPEQTLDLVLRPGAANPTVHKNGSGRLYWTVVTKYYKKIQPGQHGLVPSTPTGMNIQRSFSRLKAEYDANGDIHFKEEALTGPVKAGETLLMKIKIDSPITIPYSLIEAALPSGAEVVENDPKEYSIKSDTSVLGNWWWNHKDVMDDHLAFFMSSFSSGKSEIRQMVRLELPGKFQMNPITLEGMYTDNVHGYSEATEIEVVDDSKPE
jgi:alpha-2-macroglobulin